MYINMYRNLSVNSSASCARFWVRACRERPPLTVLLSDALLVRYGAMRVRKNVALSNADRDRIHSNGMRACGTVCACVRTRCLRQGVQHVVSNHFEFSIALCAFGATTWKSMCPRSIPNSIHFYWQTVCERVFDWIAVILVFFTCHWCIPAFSHVVKKFWLQTYQQKKNRMKWKTILILEIICEKHYANTVLSWALPPRRAKCKKN